MHILFFLSHDLLTEPDCVIVSCVWPGSHSVPAVKRVRCIVYLRKVVKEKEGKRGKERKIKRDRDKDRDRDRRAGRHKKRGGVIVRQTKKKGKKRRRRRARQEGSRKTPKSNSQFLHFSLLPLAFSLLFSCFPPLSCTTHVPL